MRYPIFLVAFFILFLSSCKKETADEIAPTGKSNTESSPSSNLNAALMLQLVNNVRKSGCNCGSTAMPPVAPVTWNDMLAKAAYNHSSDMQARNYFDHVAADGSNPGMRITATGYSWRAYGENIAKGYSSEADVVKGWIHSEGHCMNIMSATFKEMGAGRAGLYWTQEFGSK